MRAVGSGCGSRVSAGNQKGDYCLAGGQEGPEPNQRFEEEGFALKRKSALSAGSRACTVIVWRGEDNGFNLGLDFE
jgi:hypothetical protein